MSEIMMYKNAPVAQVVRAGIIPYDNSSSGLTATNMQDAIDELGGGVNSLNENKVDKETGKGLFSGSYTDLTDKPTIPAAQVNSDWNSSSGVSEILNKPAVNKVYEENTTGAAPYRVLLSASYDDTSKDDTTKKCNKFRFNPNTCELNVSNNTGTTTADSLSTVVIGNNTPAGTAGSSTGRLFLYSDGTKAVDLRAASNSSATRTIYLPNAAGTLALTSDLPTSTRTNTTNGILFSYGNVRIFHVIPGSPSQFTIPYLYQWSTEIPSGSRPAVSVNFMGYLVDANSDVKGYIDGIVDKNGNVIFRTSNGTTGSYYIRATAMWAV